MITGLSLTNFKCYKHLDNQELTRINVLAGLNGRGKSSFLQPLLLLAQSFDKSNGINFLKISGRYLDLGKFSDLINKDADVKEFTIAITTDDPSENHLVFTFEEFPNKPTLANMSSLLVDGKETSAAVGENRSDVSSNNKTFGLTSSLAGMQQLNNLYYIVADRLGPQNDAKVNDELLPTQVGKHGENLINILSINEDKIKLISKELSYIMHGASIRTSKSDETTIKLFIDSFDNSNGFMPVNVGFGYSYVLPIVLTLILAEDNSKIFLENPEAHLHPGAQSRLLDFIVRQAKVHNYQLFIETHSDHIINGLRIAIKQEEMNKEDGTILYFDNNKNPSSMPVVEEIRIDKNGNLSKYPQGFMEEWTDQMVKLM